MSDLGLPTHVTTEIDSPIRETRLTAVDELSRLAGEADLAMAAAARRALEALTQDDSRTVSAAAAAALERTAIRLRPDRVDFGQVPPGTPRVVADVLVDGPPLATATATVTVSGPGLRAMLAGRQLRILWQPRSEWLDGSVTVRGPAGWAEVRVTGQVPTAAPPMTRTGVEAQMRAVDGLSTYGPPRVTVLPPPRARRRGRAGAVALVGGLTALVLLGGVGVAWALVSDQQDGTGSLAEPPPTSAPALGTAQVGNAPQAGNAPTPVTTISREPLAHRVVSVAKPAVIGTIKVGNEPEGTAVSPDSRTLYVANQSSHVLSVVDAGTRQVSAVTLRDTPRFVAVSRDGRQVFVSMYENDKSGSGVAVLDAAGRDVDHYLDTGKQPYALSVSPDGQVWVPIHSAGRIEIYTAGQQRAVGRITVPANPHAIGYAGDLQRAFTANHESNVVAVVDMRSDKLFKSVPVSKSPHSLAVSPDGRRVLVAGYDADAADLIDTVTLRRTGPVKVGHQPQSVAWAADGEHGYVVNEGDNTISVLDGHTGKLTATIPVGHSPRTIAVAPDGRLAYVSNGDDDTVSVLQVGE
ncbi:YncE family protein [Actinoplanes sp. KI2]|uniref:YncE family protein n=1 Tax=Actinoplanes sp. KI2 TaxID=2983315 RepID=UPI0021D5E02F|nr:YncE family protein [Actinoplanes sp. KI2]MCU7722841.1 YncE family protein [Actinoplanes sp. KI2]